LESSKDTVVLAPIVTSVRSTYSRQSLASIGADKDEWEELIRNESISAMEHEILKHQGEFTNLKVVDRHTIEKLIRELEVSLMFSSDDRVQLGKMTGATHIVACEFFRTFQINSMRKYVNYDTYNFRLIDIQTGEVLATQSMTRKYRV